MKHIEMDLTDDQARQLLMALENNVLHVRDLCNLMASMTKQEKKQQEMIAVSLYYDACSALGEERQYV